MVATFLWQKSGAVFALATPPEPCWGLGGGEDELIARLYFFHIFIVDLLWNTADKYIDHNEQYKSAE